MREHLLGAAQILEWSQPAEQIDEERGVHAPLDVRVIAVDRDGQLAPPSRDERIVAGAADDEQVLVAQLLARVLRADDGHPRRDAPGDLREPPEDGQHHRHLGGRGLLGDDDGGFAEVRHAREGEAVEGEQLHVVHAGEVSELLDVQHRVPRDRHSR